MPKLSILSESHSLSSYFWPTINTECITNQTTANERVNEMKLNGKKNPHKFNLCFSLSCRKKFERDRKLIYTNKLMTDENLCTIKQIISQRDSWSHAQPHAYHKLFTDWALCEHRNGAMPLLLRCYAFEHRYRYKHTPYRRGFERSPWKCA